MQRQRRMSNTQRSKRRKEARTRISTDTTMDKDESAPSTEQTGLKSLREKQNKILDILSEEHYADNRENSSLLVATMAEAFKKKFNALERKLSDVQCENKRLKNHLRRMKSCSENIQNIDATTSPYATASTDATTNKCINTHIDNIDASTQTSPPINIHESDRHESDRESTSSDQNTEEEFDMCTDESCASIFEDLSLTTMNNDVLLCLLSLMKDDDEEALLKASEALHLLGQTLGYTGPNTDTVHEQALNQSEQDDKQDFIGDKHDELTEATDPMTIIDVESKDTCDEHKINSHGRTNEQDGQALICYDEHGGDDENRLIHDYEDGIGAACFQTNHIIQRNYGMSSPVPLKRSHFHELEGILGIDPDESIEYNGTYSYYDPRRECAEVNGDCDGILLVEGKLVAKGFEVLAQERDDLINELMALYDLERIHQSGKMPDANNPEDEPVEYIKNS